MKFIFSLILLSVFMSATCFKNIGYYWRDYTGEIPENALPGGNDKNGNPTYVAQVYIPNHGLLPTRLYRGQKSVTTSRLGIHTSDFFVKVLCSDQPKNLVWVSGTAENLHMETLGKHLVPGGTENDKILNIARVKYQGEVVVGKLCGYIMGDAKMFFPYEGKEEFSKSYEVLTYKDSV